MAKKTIKFNVNPLFGGPSLEARTRSGNPYRELRLAEIEVDPDQPRRVFDSGSLTELAESIKEYGVLCPVLVRIMSTGTSRLVAGERRLRAAKLAGLETIPAVIDASPSEDVDFLAKQLVENIQRADLTPMERSLAIGQLRDRYQWSIREIASHLSVSKGIVQRSLEILELPDDLQAALIAGASESKVLLLSKITSRESRKQLIAQLDKLSRSELEEIIAKWDRSVDSLGEAYHGGTENLRQRIELSVEDQRIIEEIQKTLGIKVHLIRKVGKAGQGKLALEFYSAEDLYEIYRRLTT